MAAKPHNRRNCERIVYGIWQSRRYLDIPRVCIEDLRFVHGSHVGPGYTSYKLSEGLADHIWVGVVTLVLDIPRRNSVTGWRSHVELDIPRRSSLKGWRIVYGIWQSRWAGYTS